MLVASNLSWSKEFTHKIQQILQITTFLPQPLQKPNAKHLLEHHL